MSIANRTLARDVFLYDSSDCKAELGGFCVTAGMTNFILHQMVEIIVAIRDFPDADPRPLRPENYCIKTTSGETVKRDKQAVRCGSYLIVSDGILEQSGERAFTRANSVTTGTRIREFRDAVRERDRGCVVTKSRNSLIPIGLWCGFGAAHIFPLAYESHWRAWGYDDLVTLVPPRGGAVNSVQNGLLLREDLHSLFDNYIFSINPDDGFKIIFFFDLENGLPGTYLDSSVMDDARGPHPELLRWHFRQAVLTNVRGDGEPFFEHDFPPGADMVGEILSGPKAAERMEFELASRLAVGAVSEDGEASRTLKLPKDRSGLTSVG